MFSFLQARHSLSQQAQEVIDLFVVSVDGIRDEWRDENIDYLLERLDAEHNEARRALLDIRDRMQRLEATNPAHDA